jgi:hypothetical protein
MINLLICYLMHYSAPSRLQDTKDSHYLFTHPLSEIVKRKISVTEANSSESVLK